ncbi:hypothetical protein C8J56DRAFT_890087 [Mycena floridula]|nr:hypothetical protein C8J56DRAFT_890087 [Mycena floridula]
MIGFPVIALLLAVKSVSAADFPAGVLATGTMGVTNPPQATMGTPINQNSDARLLTYSSLRVSRLTCLIIRIGVSLHQRLLTQRSRMSVWKGEVVAWCTKPRNNARLIPDGTLTGVQFLKNDFYVQVMAIGDFTKLNLQAGDSGGELDPHGAEGTGNPIGGNVTSAITGTDQHFAEWMLYTYVCINANSTYSAAAMCWHELDIMGCEFVMPGRPLSTFYIAWLISDSSHFSLLCSSVNPVTPTLHTLPDGTPQSSTEPAHQRMPPSRPPVLAASGTALITDGSTIKLTSRTPREFGNQQDILPDMRGLMAII